MHQHNITNIAIFSTIAILGVILHTVLCCNSKSHGNLYLCLGLSVVYLTAIILIYIFYPSSECGCGQDDSQDDSQDVFQEDSQEDSQQKENFVFMTKALKCPCNKKEVVENYVDTSNSCGRQYIGKPINFEYTSMIDDNGEFIGNNCQRQ